MLSYFLTYSILLSPTSQRLAIPLSLQNGKRAACFPVFQQGGIKDDRSSQAVILRIRAVWACELTRLLLAIKMAGRCKTKRFAIFPLVKFLHPLYFYP